MKHVKQIRIDVEDGRWEEALVEVEELLSLGPSNLEALKIKAFLYGAQGQFKLESVIWRKVLELDPDDVQAQQFFQRAYQEERENFYFTDELPSGGKRFLAYSRAIVYASFLGLLGCALFLLYSHLVRYSSKAVNIEVSLAFFLVLVLLPWVFIVFAYLKSLREVFVTRDGLRFSTLLKSYSIGWQDIEKFYLTYNTSGKAWRGNLSLVFVPKDQAGHLVEVDIDGQTSSIKSPHYFLREVVCMYGGEPICLRRENLRLSDKPMILF
ncbi:MAG: hypothetical protein KA436_02195 [Oligoflexales bacterium]|nr:hypothetical protein [Oligoflexales bacterium]